MRSEFESTARHPDSGANRVVVTGLGTVSPLGLDIDSTWAALRAGRSGIGFTNRVGSSWPQAPIAGEVSDFKPELILSRKRVRHMDRYSQMGLAATLEAVADAELPSMELGNRAGVAVGTGLGGHTVLTEQMRVFSKFGPRRISPFMLPGLLPDSLSGEIAIELGATGPNMAIISASATGASAIGEAAEIIRRGDADVMIAGASEAPLTPMLYAAFAAMGTLADPGRDPARACRPFDAKRTGFVVAEGAGIVVLESWEHARSRRARVYAELAGYGSANDAFDMVASEPTGRGPVLSMNMALRKAKTPLEDLTYVNAHGTGTPMNDRVESYAIKRVFGPLATSVAVSSTKAMTGHLMGAAGALEAVISVLTLHHRLLPPTINYEHRDPDCDLDYIPGEARHVPDIKAVLSHSIGLGGHNASLIFRRL